METDCVFDPLKLNWCNDFDRQVINLLENVRLTRAEVDDMARLFSDLQNILQQIWRGCRVMPFGSILAGLGIRSSDVDCFVYIPEHYNMDQVQSVISARNIMRKRQQLFFRPFAITTAKVPIVKFHHVPTRRQCDVNFKSPAGVRNSKLIAFLLHMDPRALHLAVIIKYWSKVHKLTGTNLLSSYALTMMTIFYLQHKDILPSVSLLQNITNGTFFVDDWNTAYSENYRHQASNTENMYELLGGFFLFYSNFQFDEYIISPFMGESVCRQLFGNVDNVPPDFGLYKNLVGQPGGLDPLKIDTPMCIQDVFEHNRNCGVAVFPRLALRIKLHFQLAATIYSETSKNKFLKEILIKKPVIPKPVKLQRPNVPKSNTDISKLSNNTVEAAKSLKRPRDIADTPDTSDRGNKNRKKENTVV